MSDAPVTQFLAEYSASEVSAMIGVGKDNLRDWRRRGLLDNIGTKEGKRGWKYSVVDIAALWSAAALSDLSSMDLSKLVARLIVSQVHLKKYKLPIKNYDYAVDEIDLGEACIFSAVHLGQRLKVRLLDSIADAPTEFTQASVIKIGPIYREMPSELKEALFVADDLGLQSRKESAKSLAEHRPKDGRF